MDLGIAGRRALVGGASSGLGRAVATRLAAEGCHLAIWARHGASLEAVASELRANFGIPITAIVADAAEPGAARMVADDAKSALGGIDILILNAGGPPPVDPTATDPAAWDRAFQLLAKTPIELSTLLLPEMRAAGWGRVVAILSSVVRQPDPNLVYSNASRSALMSWLKTVAGTVAADGVTVNGVLPGRYDTPRIDELDNASAARTGRAVEDVRAERRAVIPAGRYGIPDELASFAVYLCSDPARYQTGTFTAVDGGLITGLP